MLQEVDQPTINEDFLGKLCHHRLAMRILSEYFY